MAGCCGCAAPEKATPGCCPTAGTAGSRHVAVFVLLAAGAAAAGGDWASAQRWGGPVREIRVRDREATRDRAGAGRRRVREHVEAGRGVDLGPRTEIGLSAVQAGAVGVRASHAELRGAVRRLLARAASRAVGRA